MEWTSWEDEGTFILHLVTQEAVETANMASGTQAQGGVDFTRFGQWMAEYQAQLVCELAVEQERSQASLVRKV